MAFDPISMTDVVIEGLDMAFEHWVEGEDHWAEKTWHAIRDEVRQTVVALSPLPPDTRALYNAFRSAVTDVLQEHGLEPWDRVASLALLFLGRIFRSVTGSRRLEGARLNILVDLS